MAALFAVAVFTSAFLLFQVQFIAARHLLPWFGGTPSVWTTCMLFFQVVLLAGYAYAHASSAFAASAPRAARRARTVHAALLLLALGLLALRVVLTGGGSPLAPDLAWKPTDPSAPVGRILAILGVTVGLPYLALAATGPLLQAWFAAWRPGVSPYRLYALSNLGSLLGLLTYPPLVEPLLTLGGQGRLWAGGFALFVTACLGVALGARSGSGGTAAETVAVAPAADTGPSAALETEPPPARGRTALWVGLAAVPSVLLLAATNQVCQEVAVIPLLWVVPLGLYLLTLVLCFESPRAYRRAFWLGAFFVSAASAAVVLYHGIFSGVAAQIAVACVVLFSASMVCHGELALHKPAPRHLTRFYLAVAAGGAAGGLLVGVVAPLVFPALWEYPLAIWAAGALVVPLLFRDRTSPLFSGRLGAPAFALFSAVAVMVHMHLFAAKKPEDLRLKIALALLVALVAVRLLIFAKRWLAASDLARAALVAAFGLLTISLGSALLDSVQGSVLVARNFYGVLRVDRRTGRESGREYLSLKHGQITHGTQYLDPPWRSRATTYYGPASGVGLAHAELRARAAGRPLSIGVVGLGTGTLALLGREGDALRFYEINDAVLRIAGRERPLFTYLADSKANAEIVLGDARISLEREAARGGAPTFDLLAVDAFSSDSIPVHLLTAESVALYLSRLKGPNSVLALHISNRALDLVPVVRRLAKHVGWPAAVVDANPDDGFEWSSTWVLLTKDRSLLDAPPIHAATEIPRADAGVGRPWTDDYSNLFGTIRWR